MPQLLWDASALIKRYVTEVGSATVNALLTATPALPMACTVLGYAEAAAILRRKLNQGVLTLVDFNAARLNLKHEVLMNPVFEILVLEENDILDGIDLNDRHNLNASDAAILTVYLRDARSRAPGFPTCVLVASDQRFVRAATAEGLATLDPESVAVKDLPAFLSAIK